MPYLFVTFTDSRPDGEQVYFALSRDGLHWQDLNNSNPVLTSGIGDRGVRDPFILRAKNRFYIIATDLRIANGKGWEAAVHAGSRDVILWESEDLVHWSLERSVTLGVPGAGCVWAPEAVYDEKQDSYLVFFASCIKLPGDEMPKHRIYGSYTEDFCTFTPPEVYIERENDVIDTTIVREGGIYYRFSKDETTKRIRLDAGRDIQGMFEEITSETLSALPGVEGPAVYYLKEQNKWCLLVDQFAAGKGYLPLVTDTLADGNFSVLEPESYDMGGLKKRHGSVLAITEEEYSYLEQAYPAKMTGR